MVNIKLSWIVISIVSLITGFVIGIYTGTKIMEVRTLPPQQIVIPVIGKGTYNVLTRDGIALIDEGKYEEAIAYFNALSVDYPNDAEILFGLAVAEAWIGNKIRAIEHASESIRNGLPEERFIAGPRDLLRPLVMIPGFNELINLDENILIHGPLLGCMTSDSVSVWVRTKNESEIEVEISRHHDFSEIVSSEKGRTSVSRDYTTVIHLSGLQPRTGYYYRISVNRIIQPDIRSFRTFPHEGSSDVFSVIFGGCAGYAPDKERMWNRIAEYSPSAFLTLGDNVYIDHPRNPAVQRYCYYRRQSRTEFRALVSTTPVYAIWDDHDFAWNDSRGGPEIDTPEWKHSVWNIFGENWNNPAYAGGEFQPGCWFDFTIADVHFIMLDGRYYRTYPGGIHVMRPDYTDMPSMLGPVQKKWLFERLSSSNATFKFIVSPVSWSFGAKPGSRDTWNGYQEEREEIFSFIEKEKIEGIILLSADRHRSDVWEIPRENGYTLHEFTSSRLTNDHVHELVPGTVFGYNEKQSFGLLRFDTTKPDPEVTFSIISIDDEEVWTQSIRRSELSFSKNNVQ